MRAPMLRVRYPEGIYVNLYGFPEWVTYARALVELPPPLSGLGVDEVRVVDVLAANEAAARSGDPLWTQSGGGDAQSATGRTVPVATPPGWVWAHVAMSRQIALVPAEVHSAFRHLGGVSTMRVDRSQRGLRAAGREGSAGEPELLPVGEAPADRVQEALKAIGAPVPDAYRRILEADGVRPVVPLVHPRYGFVLDQPLFGVATPNWLWRVDYANRWLRDRFTEDLLAIGYVQGGIILLALQGERAGSVWYWDDDNLEDDDRFDAGVVSRDLTYRCADSLEEFWRALVPVPYRLVELARSLVDQGAARVVTGELQGRSLPAAYRPPSRP